MGAAGEEEEEDSGGHQDGGEGGQPEGQGDAEPGREADQCQATYSSREVQHRLYNGGAGREQQGRHGVAVRGVQETAAVLGGSSVGMRGAAVDSGVGQVAAAVGSRHLH